jgi:hypothetical protein
MNLESVSLVAVAKVRLEVLVLIQKVGVEEEEEAPRLEMLDQRREWQLLQRVMVSNVMLQAEGAEEAALKIVKPVIDSAEEVPLKAEEEEERQERMHCLMEEAEVVVEQEALKMARARMVAETLTKAFLTSAGEVASFQ